MKIVTRPIVMTYAFNVNDGNENDMEQFVKEYTEKVETLMHYESTETVFL